MKKSMVFLALLTAGILAKEVTATRAHRFIVECLSPDEANSVITKDINNLNAEEKKQFTERTMICIEKKQTKAEQLITRAMGNHLFFSLRN